MIHQAPSGDLAIRQGPWKAIFHKSGQRELFNLARDLSETEDVLATNPEVAKSLKLLMQSYIARGRSTPGAPQSNERSLALPDGDNSVKSKQRKKNQRGERPDPPN